MAISDCLFFECIILSQIHQTSNLMCPKSIKHQTWCAPNPSNIKPDVPQIHHISNLMCPKSIKHQTYISSQIYLAHALLIYLKKLCAKNDTITVIITILMNWTFFKGISTKTASYPCQNVFEKVSVYNSNSLTTSLREPFSVQSSVECI